MPCSMFVFTYDRDVFKRGLSLLRNRSTVMPTHNNLLVVKEQIYHPFGATREICRVKKNIKICALALSEPKRRTFLY